MDPGLHLGVAEQEQCRAEAAGRAGAGRLVRVHAELLDEQTAVVLHAVFQGGLHLRRGAFLRAEGIGGAVRPGERVRDVAHDRDLRVFDARVEAGAVHADDFGEVLAPSDELVPVGVVELHAEGRGETHAAVVGGGPADGDGQVRVPGVQRGFHEFTGPAGGGARRVALFLRDQRQAGGLGHLEDGFRVGEHAVRGGPVLHERAVDRDGDESSAARLHDRFDCAFASVRHRDAGAFALAEDVVRRLCQKLNGFFAGQGSLERVRGKQ